MSEGEVGWGNFAMSYGNDRWPISGATDASICLFGFSWLREKFSFHLDDDSTCCCCLERSKLDWRRILWPGLDGFGRRIRGGMHKLHSLLVVIWSQPKISRGVWSYSYQTPVNQTRERIWTAWEYIIHLHYLIRHSRQIPENCPTQFHANILIY